MRYTGKSHPLVTRVPFPLSLPASLGSEGAVIWEQTDRKGKTPWLLSNCLVSPSHAGASVSSPDRSTGSVSSLGYLTSAGADRACEAAAIHSTDWRSKVTPCCPSCPNRQAAALWGKSEEKECLNWHSSQDRGFMSPSGATEYASYLLLMT